MYHAVIRCICCCFLVSNFSKSPTRHSLLTFLPLQTGWLCLARRLMPGAMMDRNKQQCFAAVFSCLPVFLPTLYCLLTRLSVCCCVFVYSAEAATSDTGHAWSQHSIGWPSGRTCVCLMTMLAMRSPWWQPCTTVSSKS